MRLSGILIHAVNEPIWRFAAVIRRGTDFGGVAAWHQRTSRRGRRQCPEWLRAGRKQLQQLHLAVNNGFRASVSFVENSQSGVDLGHALQDKGISSIPFHNSLIQLAFQPSSLRPSSPSRSPARTSNSCQSDNRWRRKASGCLPETCRLSQTSYGSGTTIRKPVMSVGAPASRAAVNTYAQFVRQSPPRTTYHLPFVGPLGSICRSVPYSA